MTQSLGGADGPRKTHKKEEADDEEDARDPSATASASSRGRGRGGGRQQGGDYVCTEQMTLPLTHAILEAEARRWPIHALETRRKGRPEPSIFCLIAVLVRRPPKHRVAQ